jgi:hypothetical protein
MVWLHTLRTGYVATTSPLRERTFSSLAGKPRTSVTRGLDTAYAECDFPRGFKYFKLVHDS